ncbi:MAG: tetratricopeptide repeat protein [Treponema sp.]|nr:tetratricopeptide repeat protein [Treponema sp.]
MPVRKSLLCLILLLPLVSGFPQENRTALWNYNTGRALEARDQMGEAVVYYNESIRIATDEINRNLADRDSYTALTWSLRRLGRHSDVIIWGERGLRLYPDDYRIIETMGESYFYMNNFDESLRFMQRYVNAIPQGGRSSVAYFFIGEIYRFRRMFHHADIAYTTAVRLEPGLALWWFRLATVREASGDFFHAVTAYEEVLRINPNHGEARNGLARSSR